MALAECVGNDALCSRQLPGFHTREGRSGRVVIQVGPQASLEFDFASCTRSEGGGFRAWACGTSWCGADVPWRAGLTCSRQAQTRAAFLQLHHPQRRDLLVHGGQIPSRHEPQSNA